MSTLEEHCRESKERLGCEWREVHEWLDGLFASIGPSHRRARHHNEGIEEARTLFGDQAVEAAELHVLADCGGRIPRRADYEDGTVDNQGLPRRASFRVLDRRK